MADKKDYKQDPKYKSKLRKPKNSSGSMEYPPMYNDKEEDRDQIRFGDVEGDSGDPFKDQDEKTEGDSEPFEHFSVDGDPYKVTAPDKPSKLNKLRKKGAPK